MKVRKIVTNNIVPISGKRTFLGKWAINLMAVTPCYNSPKYWHLEYYYVSRCPKYLKIEDICWTCLRKGEAKKVYPRFFGKGRYI